MNEKTATEKVNRDNTANDGSYKRVSSFLKDDTLTSQFSPDTITKAKKKLKKSMGLGTPEEK